MNENERMIVENDSELPEFHYANGSVLFRSAAHQAAAAANGKLNNHFCSPFSPLLRVD